MVPFHEYNNINNLYLFVDFIIQGPYPLVDGIDSLGRYLLTQIKNVDKIRSGGVKIRQEYLQPTVDIKPVAFLS
jgi:hypothetical protein